MVIQCAWCKKILGLKVPYIDSSITHGICSDCKQAELDKLNNKEVSNA